MEVDSKFYMHLFAGQRGQELGENLLGKQGLDWYMCFFGVNSLRTVMKFCKNPMHGK